ncbi:DUF3347 domain-containing protein [Chitinophaga tropicalis]|uniref:DUF3347 domain-containing protein n=1 Tax=Chitinophaga tropicalis TaxID=2683588 RepID=A0A7K1U0U9_9BACT|nr:DUF3347 domain-containing protein [Chitinophaga tropicalis]MVT07920.1 DUF3347 domain-containing protein [Chitinophaga tropicalis]
MKKIFISAVVLTSVIFAACNNSNQSHDGHAQDTAATAGETAKEEEAVAEVKPRFATADAKVTASLKPVIDHYLHIKNGLAGDNSAEVASAGKAMAEAMTTVDKSAMTADEKKVYAENEEDLKEHAEHISKNEGNIEHQREHFAQMSEDIYALVKAFGGGQPLYYDHCPMYDNNKGAYWLSETKEIKNPYFGGKMPTCGITKELIK